MGENGAFTEEGGVFGGETRVFMLQKPKRGKSDIGESAQ